MPFEGSTARSQRLTPQEIADAQSDLLSFLGLMFRRELNQPLKRNWHQEVVCTALEKVVLGRTKRLIINIPPRAGKTEIAVKQFMAWSGGLFPDSEFIHASYSKRLAARNTYETRALMQSETYRQIFPHVVMAGDSTAKDEFRTAQGGIFYATGAEGTITGYGAGKMREGFGGAILIDDPHKAGEATSPLMRQNVIDWFQMTMESRKNRDDTPIILVMQRLHEEDLAGWLLEGNNGEKWEHIKIPAVVDGASFWEDQFPLASLEAREKASAFVFAGQYMQNPIPEGGGLFKKDWFEIVEAAPANVDWVRGWDLAATAEEGGARTAGVLLGRAPDGVFYIRDTVAEWLSPDGVFRTIRNTATQDGQQVRGSLPQDPGQAGKAQVTALIRHLAGFNYKASPESGDKYTRAQPVAAQAEAGNIKLVRGPWVHGFLEEVCAFPFGKRADIVDALSRAFSEHVTKRRAAVFGTYG
jgi:predicted phage terminase large subunit-like protein